MMMNTESEQMEKIVELLEKLNISAQNRTLAISYLKGEAGDEVFAQFEPMSFSRVSCETQQEVKKLMKSPHRKRLFDVLYAIGHGSCAKVFSYCITEVLDNEDYALYKRLVVWMDCGNYTLMTEQRGNLMRKAHNSLEVLRGLVEPLLEEEGQRYALNVLSVYFCVKYPSADKLSDENKEDAALMKLYENLLLGVLHVWLVQKGYDAHQQVIDAVRSGQLTKEMADSVGGCGKGNGEIWQLFQYMGSTAYLNFRLSEILRNIVRACVAFDVYEALFSMKDAYMQESQSITAAGAAYDELFGIDPENYICWAAVTKSTPILKQQLAKHPDSYLKALEPKRYQTLNRSYKNQYFHVFNVEETVLFLKDLLKEENPALYQQVIGSKKQNHDRMISELVSNVHHADLAKEYLRGNCAVSELYPYEKEYMDGVQYGYHLSDALSKYQRHCNDQEFINRCKVFLVIGGCIYFKLDRRTIEGVKAFFAVLDAEQLDIAHQLSGFSLLYKGGEYYTGCSASLILEGAEEVFAAYLASRREETLTAFSSAGAEGRYLALRVLQKDASQYKQEILGYAADSAKLVKGTLVDILCEQTAWTEEVKALLQAKKAAQREMAVQVLTRWQQKSGGFNEVLLQAMEKEKNAKVLALMQTALNIEENGSESKPLAKEDLVEQMHRGGRKKSLAWAYATPFSVVHQTTGEEAPEKYLQAVLLCYALQEKGGVSKNAAHLTEVLDKAEFARYVNELFDKWMEAGADAKKRWVLYAASIHGGEDIIQKLHHEIQEWPQAARGAIAAEAVKALALNPSPRALLLVDGIARKFKFKQVRSAAGEALEFAATELGITREELSDRIVPNLGFDETMQRIFDYGARIFKVMLTPALELEVYDENGKKLKNLPAPGKKDDEAKAAAAYDAFKEMKKQMKTAVSSQKARLEYALSAKREWSVAGWTNLFVKNPLMHSFAIGLVWGVYEDGRLTQSFRYMEDGSFNTQDGEEYTLPAQARISLVHPIELSDAEAAAWKEQLSDYEITQPIEQLDRQIYKVTEEEAARRSMVRFGGSIVNDRALNGKLTGLGWYHGSVKDGGFFDMYYREDAELGMGVELHFSGNAIGGYYESVTLYDARFYKAGTVERGSYVYDEADKHKAYQLKDVPPRYFSEMVLQIAQVAASSDERDEDWEKEAELL